LRPALAEALSREAVRERLLAGMVQAASRHGYARASVARVIEAAGVSRATFYEHFANKEECFLAAYRDIAARMRARIRAAAERAAVADRPRVVLAELLGGVAEDPDAARLVLVEALGAATSIRAEHERLIADTEDAIERFLDQPKVGAGLQVPAVALLGGVAGMLSVRILDGEGGSVLALLEPLAAWVASHAVGDGRRCWRSADWRAQGRRYRLSLESLEDRGPVLLLPRGPGVLEPAHAAQERRRRILDATARIVREKGYAGLNVAEIATAARISRGVFYSQFRNKEDVFLAAQAVGMEESVALAARAFFVTAEWPERVWRASEALLGYVAAHPDLAQLTLVETYAAGPAAIRSASDNRLAYALFIEEGYRLLGDGGDVPRLCSEAIAGAIFGLMSRQVMRGKTGEMLEILPATAYVALAPFTGPTAAARFVEARAPLVRQGPGAGR
jgi:AcrR family transcriptional regulator